MSVCQINTGVIILPLSKAVWAAVSVALLSFFVYQVTISCTSLKPTILCLATRGYQKQAVNTNTDILSSFSWYGNMLANSFLFKHPANWRNVSIHLELCFWSPLMPEGNICIFTNEVRLAGGKKLFVTEVNMSQDLFTDCLWGPLWPHFADKS